MQFNRQIAALLASLMLPACIANAEEPYRMGTSVGLNGYIAGNDRGWRDGLQLAVDALNAKNGIMGRKVELIVEDNRSQPQDAVLGYKKMIGVDHVQVFLSGCLSSGNFAGAPAAVEAKIPLLTCGILPQSPEHLRWMFSLRPSAGFQMEAPFRYLKAKTQIRKVGFLHDPTPYSMLQTKIGLQMAQKHGIEVIAQETYNQNDADMSVQIGQLARAGAEAIVKIGLGGSTVTAAKNVAQLGLKTILIGSQDDLSVIRPAGKALPDQFLFVTANLQSPENVHSLPPGLARERAEEFLKAWESKYKGRDPLAAAGAWDGVFLVAHAIETTKSFDSAKLRDTLETQSPYQGAAIVYKFSSGNHDVSDNPHVIGKFVGDRVVVQE